MAFKVPVKAPKFGGTGPWKEFARSVSPSMASKGMERVELQPPLEVTVPLTPKRPSASGVEDWVRTALTLAEVLGLDVEVSVPW